MPKLSLLPVSWKLILLIFSCEKPPIYSFFFFRLFAFVSFNFVKKYIKFVEWNQESYLTYPAQLILASKIHTDTKIKAKLCFVPIDKLLQVYLNSFH